MNEVPLSVLFLKLIPLKTTSLFWGSIMDIEIPVPLRSVLYSCYAKVTGANLDEVEEPLVAYKTMNAFFTRKLKDNIHSVDKDAMLVSPSDGRVLGFGAYSVSENFAKNIIINHVKGFKFSLHQLLGEPIDEPSDTIGDPAIELVEKRPKRSFASQTSKKLFYCTIYLAPSDYHRFHSPVNWNVSGMRRISGELFPVFPKLLKKIPLLYVLNERVPLLGTWDYGQFSMTLVGSTNVGSIKIHDDQDALWRSPIIKPWTTNVELVPDTPLKWKKGEEIGYFKMGSTIVLVFEAPHEFQFCIKEGQYIRMGQKLGHIDHC